MGNIVAGRTPPESGPGFGFRFGFGFGSGFDFGFGFGFGPGFELGGAASGGSGMNVKFVIRRLAFAGARRMSAQTFGCWCDGILNTNMES